MPYKNREQQLQYYRNYYKDNSNKIREQNRKYKKDYPEISLDISNGRTLCFKCHKKRHGWN